MRTLTLALLILPFLLAACDSGGAGDDDPSFPGRYTGSHTVTFLSDSATGSIRYDIEFDLDEPDADGMFTGVAVITRGAVDDTPAQTLSGSVQGQGVGGFILSASVARAEDGGAGVSLFMQGSASGGRLTSRNSTIADFAYGRSVPFELTLSK